MEIGSTGDAVQGMAHALRVEVMDFVKKDTTGHMAGRTIKAARFLKTELANMAGDGVAELDTKVDRLIADLKAAQVL